MRSLGFVVILACAAACGRKGGDTRSAELSAAPASAAQTAEATGPAPPVVEASTAEAVPADPPIPPLAAAPVERGGRYSDLGDAGPCPENSDGDVGLWWSPQRPAAGQPVTVLAATLKGEQALALALDGALELKETERRDGIPAMVLAKFVPSDAGVVELRVGREGRGLRCARVRVGRRARSSAEGSAQIGVWPMERAWTLAEEALFSAWVRTLFDAPTGESLAFSALEEMTRDPKRNRLHNHFGWDEDDRRGLKLVPDCADTPYFLRAYYAWKRHLPFGFRRCNRGRGKAPRCTELISGRREEDEAPSTELVRVRRFFRRTLRSGVHTGNGRTALDDANTDFYPVALTRAGVRPGTIYADPYGHVFVVVDWVPPAGKAPGILYAVDGQPDGSITRKRFWPGNFLWNADPKLGGSGFKAFRPVRVTGGVLASEDDATVARRFGDHSLEQGSLDATAFYDRMDALITPGVRDPYAVLDSLVRALHEAAQVRVTSVNNGVRYIAEHPGTVIEMPEGYRIFETTGAWENFSTPARDLRFLVAMDVVRGFIDQVRRQPAAFGVTDVEATVARLTARLEARLNDPRTAITYKASDGAERSRTLAQLIARADAFEMAYNPNDCVEVRWGEAPSSAERATCDRHAPAAQIERMAAYRPWFARRQRPPRGAKAPAAAVNPGSGG